MPTRVLSARHLSWPLLDIPALSTPSCLARTYPSGQLVSLGVRGGPHGRTSQLYHSQYMGYCGTILVRNVIIQMGKGH